MKRVISLVILGVLVLASQAKAHPANMYQVQGGPRENYLLQPTERMNQAQPARATIQSDPEDGDNLQGTGNPFYINKLTVN